MSTMKNKEQEEQTSKVKAPTSVPLAETSLAKMMTEDVAARLEDVKKDANAGDVQKSREGITALSRFVGDNNDELTRISRMDPGNDPLMKLHVQRAQSLVNGDMGTPDGVMSIEADYSERALLYGAKQGETTIEVSKHVADLRNHRASSFMTGVLDVADARAREQSEGRNSISWRGDPSQRVIAGARWEQRGLSNERIKPFMGDDDFQYAFSDAVNIGFSVGKSPTEQDALISTFLGAAEKIAPGGNVEERTTALKAITQGYRDAIGTMAVGKDGKGIPGTGFSSVVGVSPEASSLLISGVAKSLSGSRLSSDQISTAVAAAASKYTEYVTDDMANMASPASFRVMAEVAVSRAALGFGQVVPLSTQADNYLGVSTGRNIAMSNLGQKDVSGFFVSSGAPAYMVGAVTPLVANLGLDETNKPLWDAMKESDMTWADLTTYACDPGEGHAKLAAMKQADGGPLIPESILDAFKSVTNQGISLAAENLHKTRGIGYQEAQTILRSQVYGIDVDSAETIKVGKQSAADVLGMLEGKYNSEDINTVASLLGGDNFVASSAGMKDADVKAAQSALKRVAQLKTLAEEKPGKRSLSEHSAASMVSGGVRSRLETPESVSIMEKARAEYESGLKYNKPKQKEAALRTMATHAIEALMVEQRATARVGGAMGDKGVDKELVNLAIAANAIPGGSPHYKVDPKSNEGAFKKEQADLLYKTLVTGGDVSPDAIIAALTKQRIDANAPRMLVFGDNRSRDRKGIDEAVSLTPEEVGALKMLADNRSKNLAETEAAYNSSLLDAGISPKRIEAFNTSVQNFMGGMELQSVKTRALTMINNERANLIEGGGGGKGNVTLAEYEKLIKVIKGAKTSASLLLSLQTSSAGFAVIEGQYAAIKENAEVKNLSKEALSKQQVIMRDVAAAEEGAPTEEAGVSTTAKAPAAPTTKSPTTTKASTSKESIDKHMSGKR